MRQQFIAKTIKNIQTHLLNSTNKVTFQYLKHSFICTKLHDKVQGYVFFKYIDYQYCHVKCQLLLKIQTPKVMQRKTN